EGKELEFEAIGGFLAECAKTKDPFCLLLCSNEPHTPWNKGDPSQYPADKVELPSYFVDTPETREAFSRYLAEITYYDWQVGQALELLKKNDLADDTMVVVVSEQGNAFPFAKWTCYDNGLQSACIVRWPGKVEAGSENPAMIEYVDFLPTFIEAAGGTPDEILDGKSILPALGGKQEHKQFVFGEMTTRGINKGSEQYGIRSVRSEQYKYIWNFTPEIKFENACTNTKEFQSWIREAEGGNAKAKQLVNGYHYRAEIELFDVVEDPLERNNLANNPEYAQIAAELRAELDRWMAHCGDEGPATEMKAMERQGRARNAKSQAKAPAKDQGKGNNTKIASPYPRVEGRWTKKKINQWYDELPWLVGANYYPATAINQIEMWQASTFDPETIDKELKLAASIGMNTMRVYLHDLVWEDDAEGLYERMDQFLTICEKHKIRPFFVFFDDCHYPTPKLGPQPLPVRAFHNSGWRNSPSRDLAKRFAEGKATPEEINRLKGYVQETIRRFANDERVLMWELYNEPGRGRGEGEDMTGKKGTKSSMGDLSNKLVHESWVWAREINPSQPITSTSKGSVGDGNIAINRNNSDLHSIHSYQGGERLEKFILEYQADGRPVMVTEWLARGNDSTVEDCLPVMKKHKVGAVNWGFVSGKSGTIWPWQSRKDRDPIEEREKGVVIKPGEPYPEPEVWHHDLFRIDGTPFDPKEIELFKKLTSEPAAKPKTTAKSKKWEFHGGDWNTDGEVISVQGSPAKAFLRNQRVDDFELTVEVRAKGRAQAGVIFRTSEPGPGPDGFCGYYIGVHAKANQAIWGRCNGSWNQIASRPMPVPANEWIKLRVVARGDQVQAWINQMPVAEGRFPKFDGVDHHYQFGGIGLRMLGEGAEFRNFNLNTDLPEVSIEGGTYTNPVQSACADPVVIHHDGMYYAYCTYTPDFPKMKRGIRMYSSPNLGNWKDEGFAITSEQSWGKSRFWAPDIVEKDGEFYLYYAADVRICVAKADHPKGPFKQIGDLPMEPESIRIDAHIFQDDDGKYYFYYVTFNKGNEIWGGELNDDMVTVKEDTLKLMVRPDQD
ncbi:MAG: family 43 glycosylhydrolase, partial [Verrucomicrobiota bacterium]